MKWQATPFNYYIFLCRDFKRLGQNPHQLHNKSHAGSNKRNLVYMSLLLPLLLTMFCLYLRIFFSIREEMRLLGTSASVKTSPVAGSLTPTYSGWNSHSLLISLTSTNTTMRLFDRFRDEHDRRRVFHFRWCGYQYFGV